MYVKANENIFFLCLVIFQGFLESRVVFLESEMKKLKSKHINQNEELKIVKKRLSNIDKTIMTLSEKYVRIQSSFSETLFSHNIFILKINFEM